MYADEYETYMSFMFRFESLSPRHLIICKQLRHLKALDIREISELVHFMRVTAPERSLALIPYSWIQSADVVATSHILTVEFHHNLKFIYAFI